MGETTIYIKIVLFFTTFAIILIKLFSLCQYGVLCEELLGQN